MVEKSAAKRIEVTLENLLFSARWLLAPFTFDFLSFKSDVILGLLTLVDLTLTGSLLIIVIFSGYENFVSKMDHSDHSDRPTNMTIFSGL